MRYDLVLVSITPVLRLPVLAAVFQIMGQGLRNAKDLVEDVTKGNPQTVASGLSEALAYEGKALLEAGWYPSTLRLGRRNLIDGDSWPRPANGEVCCQVELRPSSAIDERTTLTGHRLMIDPID